MKILLIIAVAIFVVKATSYKEEWLSFKAQYGKVFKNSQEETYRFNIFQENLKKINNHNQNYEDGKTSFKMGINKFADFTNEEFIKTLKYHQKDVTDISEKQYYLSKFVSDIPDSIDWREKGTVTPVKNQGISGSSCIFGITGSLEGAYFLKSGNLVPLSEQNLADCTGESRLCDEKAIYEWVKENGIMSDADYPSGGDSTCHFNKSKIVTKISSYQFIKANDEVELQIAVATVGPIAAEIQACQSFQFYTSGILDDPDCFSNTLNHAVLIVGYGTQNGQAYWIVKNSWGTAWGDGGYALLSRNKNNQCGIAAGASYPII